MTLTPKKDDDGKFKADIFAQLTDKLDNLDAADNMIVVTSDVLAAIDKSTQEYMKQHNLATAYFASHRSHSVGVAGSVGDACSAQDMITQEGDEARHYTQ